MLRRGAIRRAAAACIALVLIGAGRPAWGADPTYITLSPSEDLDETPGDVVLAISIDDPDHVIDAASIRFIIDGRDVTSQSQIAPDLVTYVPPKPLLPGPHRIELQVHAIGGAGLPGLTHEFRTAGEPMGLQPEKAWQTKGRITLEALADDVSGPGAELRQEPDQTETGRLDMNGHVGGWKYDALLYLTSDEDHAFQPRNRYSLHVDRNWVGLDLGDINYYFSEFIMQGKRARGIGGYVRFGETEIRVVHGAINRTISPAYAYDPEVPDSLVGVSDASFERNLFGARISMGRGKTYQAGLDVIRVRDDVHSLSLGDTLGVFPKDNLVIGSNLIWAPFHRRVILEGDAAVSALTDDISDGAMPADSIETLVPSADLPSWFHPEDWDNIFIVNPSTIPLDPSSLSNLAFRGGARGNLYGNIFEAKYQYVGPTFYSLAAPSIQNDKEGFRLTDSFRVLRHKLELQGEFEEFSDNLKDDKEFTTDTNIAGVNANFVPGRVDLKSVNFGFRRYRRQDDRPAATDSLNLRLDETTNTLRVGAGYHFWYLQGHELNASYLYSKTDALQDPGDSRQTDWTLAYTTAFESVPLGAEVQYGVNRTEYPGGSPASHVTYNTWGIGGTYRFLDDRLESFASLLWVSGDGTGGFSPTDKTTLNGGARYRLSERTTLAGRLGIVRFSDNASSANDYDENVFNLRLVQDF